MTAAGLALAPLTLHELNARVQLAASELAWVVVAVYADGGTLSGPSDPSDARIRALVAELDRLQSAASARLAG